MNLGRLESPLGVRTGNAAHTSARSAFTMVELMVVILVLVLATSIVSLSFEALVPGERLNTSVRNLAGTLAETRSLALSRNMEYFLEYDLDEDRYRLVTNEHVDGGPWIQDSHPEDERVTYGWEDTRPGVELHAVYLAGQFFNDGKVLVRFDPLGAVSDHSIVLGQPEFQNLFTIEMLPLTGLIRFHEGEFLEREMPTDRDFD